MKAKLSINRPFYAWAIKDNGDETTFDIIENILLGNQTGVTHFQTKLKYDTFTPLSYSIGVPIGPGISRIRIYDIAIDDDKIVIVGSFYDYENFIEPTVILKMSFDGTIIKAIKIESNAYLGNVSKSSGKLFFEEDGYVILTKIGAVKVSKDLEQVSVLQYQPNDEQYNTDLLKLQDGYLLIRTNTDVYTLFELIWLDDQLNVVSSKQYISSETIGITPNSLGAIHDDAVFVTWEHGIAKLQQDGTIVKSVSFDLNLYSKDFALIQMGDELLLTTKDIINLFFNDELEIISQKGYNFECGGIYNPHWTFDHNGNLILAYLVQGIQQYLPPGYGGPDATLVGIFDGHTPLKFYLVQSERFFALSKNIMLGYDLDIDTIRFRNLEIIAPSMSIDVTDYVQPSDVSINLTDNTSQVSMQDFTVTKTDVTSTSNIVDITNQVFVHDWIKVVEEYVLQHWSDTKVGG